MGAWAVRLPGARGIVPATSTVGADEKLETGFFPKLAAPLGR